MHVPGPIVSPPLPRPRPPRGSHAALKSLLRGAHRCAAAGLLIAAAGCASIPRSDTTAAQIPELACDGLAQELAQARDTEAVAEEARRRAWRVVLPVLAAGRYAYAANAKQQAAERVALVEEEMRRKGCPPPPSEPEAQPQHAPEPATVPDGSR